MSKSLRIVSLIASATEILHALGLTPFQVGRSHECDFPPSVLPLPVCTRPRFPVGGSSAEIDRLVKTRLSAAASVYEVFPDVIESLRPTHILTQTHCRVCAVSLEDVERALCGPLSSRPTLVALEPDSLAAIRSDILRAADACGVSQAGADLAASLDARMSATSAACLASPLRPSVACLEWHEPLMAAGNWVPELVALAGGRNLFGVAGAHSPWMSWDALLAAQPSVIVSMPCGFDLARTRSEMYWLTARPGWSGLAAVRSGRVFLADGNRYLNRPGPGIAESLQILAEILHPDLFAPSMENQAWLRWTV